MMYKSTFGGKNVEYFECEKLMDCSLLLNFSSLRIHVSLLISFPYVIQNVKESSPDGKALSVACFKRTEGK